MKIYAVTIGFYDVTYLDYFLKKESAIAFKKECEDALSRDEWDDLPNIVEAKKIWSDYRTELNVKFGTRPLHQLSTTIRQKWSELYNAWQYNSNWGHSDYDIQEIDLKD
jgi:hypothetical protein